MRVRLFHLPVMLPRERAPRGPFINILPVGLLALAGRLVREGHRVEVVHAGVERRLDPGFDVVEDLTASPVDLVGFALHWHPQLGPVSEAVEQLDARLPGLPVVLGGLTASAFAAELLEAWPGVDFVIRGEAETPLSRLTARLAEDPGAPAPWREVENLAYRGDGGAPVLNPLAYVADQAALDGLEPCRLDLLRHGEHYNGQFAESAAGWSHAPVFYLTVGRGCTVDCAFCSGGRSGHRALAGRQGVGYRSVDRVVDDLRQLVERGIHTAAVCFDPPGASDRYYRELFGAVAAAGLRLSLVFECYRPPRPGFVELFAETFAVAGSRLSFSPTVGDEALRARILGVRYTNRDLERALADCRRFGVETTCYFATLPQESRAQLEASLSWQRALVERFDCRLIHSPIEMEPGAPWEAAPAEHGLGQPRTGFAAYVERHREGSIGVCYRDEVGYDFPDVDARTVRLRSVGLDPVDGLAVALSTCGQRVGGRFVIAPLALLDDVLGALSCWRGQPVCLLLAGEPSSDGGRSVTEPDWRLAERVADGLGPNVEVALYPPALARHRAWDPARVAASPRGDASLEVLHLHDARAAGALSALDCRSLPATAVLGEVCRWCPAPCPALELRLLAFAVDGTVRCCSADPGVRLGARPDELERLRREQAERRAELERRRGCGSCEVRERCARCIYLGHLPESVYCEVRRALGPSGLVGARDMVERHLRASHIDIGWDG